MFRNFILLYISIPSNIILHFPMKVLVTPHNYLSTSNLPFWYLVSSFLFNKKTTV